MPGPAGGRPSQASAQSPHIPVAALLPKDVFRSGERRETAAASAQSPHIPVAALLPKDVFRSGERRETAAALTAAEPPPAGQEAPVALWRPLAVLHRFLC